MNVFDAVRTVLAVRKYQNRPIPPDSIQRIVEAAHLTGSGSNQQPWHFVVVDDRDTLRKLGEMARTGPYVAQAAVAIVVAIEESRLAESDASRAIQSMVLTAWEEGIGSNWVGFYGLDAANPLLGIPDSLKVIAIIPLGFPDQPAGKGRKKRKPLSEVVSLNRFGQPFKGRP